HGLDVFLDGNVNNSTYMSHPNWSSQFWGGNTCPSTYLQNNDQNPGFDENVWVGTQSLWLWDCRAGRPCTNGTKYPVEVFQRNGGDTTPGGAVDHSWWARWQDPMDGNQWRGLGPVKFWCTGGGYCTTLGADAAGENHYLVDCDAITPTCYACP